MKELMVTVERVVRPLRASAGRKNRLREELLAHLKCILDEELARHSDPAAARAAAIERFGASPGDLTRALQDATPFPERVAFGVERWFGWQAPESAARYTFRLAWLLLAVSIVLTAPLIAWTSAEAIRVGEPMSDLLPRLSLGLVFLFVTCMDTFLLGLLYFKLRDRLCGTPWAARSRPRVVLLALLFAAVVFLSGFAVPLLATGEQEPVRALWPYWGLVSLLAPVFPVVYARVHGAAEIRHTEWACLDIASPG